MAQELKIRIKDYKQVEETLKGLGATFMGEEYFVDTYFNQPRGEILKIRENVGGYFLRVLKETDGKFDLIKNDKLENPQQVKNDLIIKYGIKRVLRGKRRVFSLDNFTITLNLIEQVGEFLILFGENPTEEFITDKLGIQNPEYIRVSFDELKQLT